MGLWVLVSTSDSVSAYNLDLNLHTCEASLSIEVHEDNWHFSAEESTLERKWRQILDESQLILHGICGFRPNLNGWLGRPQQVCRSCLRQIGVGAAQHMS